MRLSRTKIYDMRRIEKGNLSTADLLERSGYMKQIQSGLYVQMNLMKRLINNVEKIVKQELEKCGCLEIELNQLQSADLWKQTGRYENYGAEMFKFKDRSDKEMIISGTNEELVTSVVKDYVNSYRDLSFTFYQINNKFRDEIRCNGGFLRGKEFSMMDAYSFHASKEELEEYYSKMRECYINILNRLGLKFKIEAADATDMGGSISEEFVVNTSDGEIEIGHIFQLDTKYSEKLDASYVDKNNTKQFIVMGCYGIGITRLAQVLADVGRIGNCFNFKSDVSAYEYAVIIGNVNNEKQKEAGEFFYKNLLKLGHSVYLDDRDVRIGQKLNEVDILGTTIKLLVGNKIEDNIYEMKTLSGNKWVEFKLNDMKKMESKFNI
jgi:prolyl-tRNA synthetase